MPHKLYKIGFSPRNSSKIDEGEVATATEALREVRGLQVSDEVIRYIRTPEGREIQVWELERLAKDEQGPPV